MFLRLFLSLSLALLTSVTMCYLEIYGYFYYGKTTFEEVQKIYSKLS